MEYYTEPSHWDLETINEEFKIFIPKGFTPLMLFYFKEYDNEIYTGDEEYLLAVYNTENAIMIFDIKVNDNDKYELIFPRLFEEINFKEIVCDDYLPDGYGPFHYDDRDDPKRLICGEINKRFLQSLAFFNECDNDGIKFKYVKLLYLEPEELSEFSKHVNEYLSYPFKHDIVEIETSLSAVDKSVYQVYNINFFFILVLCYDIEEGFYTASIYNHKIDLTPGYMKYEYYFELDVGSEDKEEFFDNLSDLYYYEKPDSRLKNVSKKKELLIDNSEDFNL